MKQIPNLFTLLNLVFGCIAIVLILQTHETIVSMDETGATMVMLPENIAMGALFIFGAAIIDFLDGFMARLFRASSDMGKQLDSLSDVVSFGVAPAMILYQLLRMGYARGENGLDVSVWALLPAFIFSAAVAWRLAKFNLSTNQVYGFKGVPSPAAGLLIASFPLIIFYGKPERASWFPDLAPALINNWLLYLIILLVSYLMVSNLPLMAMKFKSYTVKDNVPKLILLVIALISIFYLRWIAVPVIFIVYIFLSLFFKEPAVAPPADKEELDITV